ncbi:hypothetical protein VTN49DRAFT_3595 [Thermomyces lanuginosus]|uniref:uncharacterized protein n=1 Tax=Thermomyces lanuginosus TaxID=5541 RepID=UPI00374286BB
MKILDRRWTAFDRPPYHMIFCNLLRSIIALPGNHLLRSYFPPSLLLVKLPRFFSLVLSSSLSFFPSLLASAILPSLSALRPSTRLFALPGLSLSVRLRSPSRLPLVSSSLAPPRCSLRVDALPSIHLFNLTGRSFPAGSPRALRVVFSLESDPRPSFRSAIATLQPVLARSADRAANLSDQGWVTLPFRRAPSHLPPLPAAPA